MVKSLVLNAAADPGMFTKPSESNASNCSAPGPRWPATRCAPGPSAPFTAPGPPESIATSPDASSNVHRCAGSHVDWADFWMDQTPVDGWNTAGSVLASPS